MFSVVIPIYNHANYLRQAVESCLTTSLVIEVLLVDDGSSDSSATLAAKLAAAHPGRIKNLSEPVPRNKGAHNRLNQLCHAATQPWIAVLNSDDLFAAHRFDLVQHMTRLYKMDFVAGAMLLIDEEGRFIGSKRGISQPEYPFPTGPGHDGPLLNEELRQLLCSQNFIATTSNMVFRKSLFLRIGGFADLRYAHDWDFALRATMLGDCLWTPNFMTYYRVHSSNTIKEVSPHMDGEITRLFYRFLADYPHLEEIPRIRESLGSNRHIAPYVSAPSAPMAPMAAEVPSAGDAYIFPAGLSRRARLNALLGVHHFGYDFVLLSANLDELPVLHCPNLDQAYVRRAPAHREGARVGAPQPGERGRLMHIPVNGDAAEVISDIRALPGWEAVQISGADLSLGEGRGATVRQCNAMAELAALLKGPEGKPVCLVLPIFMAVGGVERNTVEMIRGLQGDYHFVVVTTERLAKAQGSLHYQLDELDVPTLDLAEIGGREHHVDLLAILAKALAPDLVWICNGSPWLIENLLAIRRLFARVPIIDQQAYDTEQGWIAYYDRKCIQSLDHFIAINARIQEKFVRQLRIPAHRVSLIYSAVNGDRLRSSRVAKEDVSAMRAQLGLAAVPARVFAFIGRLTAQKRPQLFLELARVSRQRGSPDQFLLVGDGGMRDMCAEFIREHGLSNVLCIPFSAQTPRLLALCDGLIVPSEYEGLPIVMLEALAVGTPVLATDVGDIKLVLEEYQAGLVFPVADDHRVALQAFADWTGNLPAYKQNAERVRDIALRRFSSETIAAGYLACFDTCRRAYGPGRSIPAGANGA